MMVVSSWDSLKNKSILNHAPILRRVRRACSLFSMCYTIFCNLSARRRVYVQSMLEKLTCWPTHSRLFSREMYTLLWWPVRIWGWVLASSFIDSWYYTWGASGYQRKKDISAFLGLFRRIKKSVNKEDNKKSPEVLHSVRISSPQKIRCCRTSRTGPGSSRHFSFRLRLNHDDLQKRSKNHQKGGTHNQSVG